MSHLLLSAITAVLAAASLGGAVKNTETKNSVAPKINAKQAAQNINGQFEVIDLKDKVMTGYYDSLDESLKAEISLEKFSQGYYEGSANIRDYTNSIIQRQEVAEPELSPKRAGGEVTSPFNNYYDGAYMISNNHANRRYLGNYSAPCTVENPTVYRLSDLPYEPNYDHPLVDSFYGYIEAGDVLIDPVFRGGDFFDCLVTHAAIVEDLAKPYFNNDGGVSTFIRTIEAEPSGVRYGIFDDERILRYGTQVYRLNVYAPDAPAGAVDFCRAQLGKVYALTAGGIPSINQSHWYCNELVWAAYYAQGVNICNTNVSNYPGSNPSYIGYIAGTMLLNSPNLQERDVFSEYYYPSVTYTGRTSTKYKFTINNYSNRTRRITYLKTANPSFGEAISNSYNSSLTNTVTLASGGSVNVEVNKNGLLNASVVFACEQGGERFMRICHSLNNDYASCFSHVLADHVGNTSTSAPVPTKTESQTAYRFFTADTCLEAHSHGGSEWYELYYDFSVADVVDEEYWDTVEFVGWHDMFNIGFYSESIYFDPSVGSFYVHAYLNKNNYVPFGWFSIDYKYQKPLELESIELAGDFQTTFYVGEFPNADDLVVIAHYADGSSREIYRPNPNLKIYSSDYEIDVPGTYYFDVEYTEGDVTASDFYEVEVIPVPTFEYLSLEGDFQTEFYVGDPFNCDELRIIANYSDGSTKDVTDQAEIYTGYVNSNRVGTYGIHIWYSENGVSRSQYYEVTYKEIPHNLVSISLNTANVQKQFVAGDSFNSNGLEVIARYDDNLQEAITGFAVDSSNFDSERLGTYDIIVSYAKDGITKSSSYQVTVRGSLIDGDLMSISVTNYPRSIVLGNTPDYSSLVVTARYSSGATAIVGDYAVDDSAVNTSLPGSYSVKVSYTEGGVTKSATFKIKIVAKSNLIFPKDPIVIKDPIIDYPGPIFGGGKL